MYGTWLFCICNMRRSKNGSRAVTPFLYHAVAYSDIDKNKPVIKPYKPWLADASGVDNTRIQAFLELYMTPRHQKLRCQIHILILYYIHTLTLCL